jgi:ligand-binding SRPBCC domain-containing protein
MDLEPFLLRREQWIPRPIEDVFAFFADAGNLGLITPPWLNFEFLTPRPIALHAGARIRSRLRWHGLALGWLAEIRRWQPPSEFVDVQVRGPYRLWHHTHRFEPAAGGTRMRDEVRNRLPLGPLGRVAHAWRVRSDLEAIFDHRARRISEILDNHHVN